MTTLHEPPAGPADFRGSLVGPDDRGYDEARALHNAMIDKRPALIARCADVADVIATVDYARNNDLRLAIRGGGHNGGGLGSVDDGVVLDLSGMRGIQYDPDTQVVHVDGGCRWGDVDHATHAFGRAVPAGIISTTGVGGLTLGGGIGHLTRSRGLTIDNLVAADVVLADGRLVRATEDEHPNLFWALRGGGGNFGVVTSFAFRTHPVHTVVAGPMLWHVDRAAEILPFYRDFIREAPEELTGFFAFLTIPPDPAYPAQLHGLRTCGVVWCWSGDAAGADAALAPVRAFATPDLDGVMPMPFPALQAAFDEFYAPGLQWYWRADFVDDLPDEAVALHAEWGATLPTLHSMMHMYPIDGAVHEVGPRDTAFAYRSSGWAAVFAGVDPDPANAGAIREWATGYQEALHPFAAGDGGAYVNFLMADDGARRVHDVYAHNWDRLVLAKAEYDPANLFRVNHNISPSG